MDNYYIHSNNNYIYCTHAVGDTTLQSSTRETSPEASTRDVGTASETTVLSTNVTQQIPAHDKRTLQENAHPQGSLSSKDSSKKKTTTRFGKGCC